MTPILTLLQHPLAQTLGWTLLHFLWQGAALGLLAWTALLLLRGASAKARYGLACACLLLMVAAPVATFLLLQPQALIPVSGPGSSLTPSLEPATVAALILPMTQRLKVTLDPALPWLLGGWALGVLLLSARFLGSWVRVQRLRRRSAEPVPAEWHLVVSRLCRELKLSRTVRLLKSAAVEVPTALGWLRPLILLPACALTGLAPLQLEAILAHELAHIRRGDFLVNLLQSLVEVLLFYHPAVWWLSSRIRAERELCCDDVAAELCGDPLLLARALAELEALREPLTPSPTHLALAANGGSLMHRIRHLIHPALPITSGARATALALLAASLLGAAGVALQDKETAPKPKAESNTHLKLKDDQRQLDIQVKGDVKLNAEAPDPVIVAGDGSFRLEEKKGGKTRTFLATKGKQSYTVDGQEQPFDAAGKEWLRAAVKETAKAQAGRVHAQQMKVRVELDRAKGEKERMRAEGRRDGEQLVEIHTRHRRDLEEHARELELHAKELEANMAALSPEERAKVQADLDRARAELDKARAEGRKIRVEVMKQHGEGPETFIIRKEEPGKDGERHIEILTEDAEPGVTIIRKKVDGKEVVEKRVKVFRHPGEGKEAEAWAFSGPEGDVTAFEGMGQDIHIPPIHIPQVHVRTHVHTGEENPQAEMAELRAELKALQTRLDQLQKQLTVTPKALKPLKAPSTPKSTHPVPPPPPPPPAPPAPDAPPAPPAPPVPPAPRTPGT
jgi:beta-lactamase regulating signal transducer with metallopeptidase domain